MFWKTLFPLQNERAARVLNQYESFHKKLCGLSPRVNYTDRVAARSAKLVPTFLRIQGCHVVSATDPHGRFNLCFSRLEPLLFYSSSSSIDLTRLSGARSRLLYGKQELIFPLEDQGNFLPILLPIAPRNDYWSPEHYCKGWKKLTGRKKANVKQSIPSGRAIYYLSVTVFPIPVNLKIPGFP